MASNSGRPNFGDVRRSALFTTLLIALLVTASCAFPPYPGSSRPVHRPTPQTTPLSSLANQTVYWSQDQSLWALSVHDGSQRWRVAPWKAPLPSCAGCPVGPEALVLANDTLYTLTINEHASAGVYAFATSDGTTRWQTSVAGCPGYPDHAPLVDGNVVYVSLTEHSSGEINCGPTGWVYALQASDGHVLWRVPFARSVFSRR